MTSIVVDKGTFAFAMVMGLSSAATFNHFQGTYISDSYNKSNSGGVEILDNSKDGSKLNNTEQSYNSLVQMKNTLDMVKKKIGTPKSELGKKLLKLRQEAIEKGMLLLSSAEIDLVIDDLRGLHR